MILWFASVHKTAQIIPLLAKEGLGVVDRDAHAQSYHLLAPLRRRVKFMEGRKLEHGPQRTGRGAKVQKDVKLDGTNSVKSCRINKSVNKTNSKRTGFCRQELSIKVKKAAKIAAKSEKLLRSRRVENTIFIKFRWPEALRDSPQEPRATLSDDWESHSFSRHVSTANGD